jgi:uracil DNA glycosylase
MVLQADLASYGWGQFTDAIIQHLNKSRSGLVFLLWGGFAQKKAKAVDKVEWNSPEKTFGSDCNTSLSIRS